MSAPRTPGVGPWPGETPGTPCPRACRCVRSTRRNSRRPPGSAPGRPPAAFARSNFCRQRARASRRSASTDLALSHCRWSISSPSSGSGSDFRFRRWSMTRLRAIWWTQARKLPPRNPVGSGLPHLRPHVLMHVVEHGQTDPPAEEREQPLRVPVVQGAEGGFGPPPVVRGIVRRAQVAASSSSVISTVSGVIVGTRNTMRAMAKQRMRARGRMTNNTIRVLRSVGQIVRPPPGRAVCRRLSFFPTR